MKYFQILTLSVLVTVGANLTVSACAAEEAPGTSDAIEAFERWNSARHALEAVAQDESEPFLRTFYAEAESRYMLRAVSEQAELELSYEERAAEAAAARDLERAAPAEYARFDEIWQMVDDDPEWIWDDNMVLGLFDLMVELREAAPQEMEALASASRAQEGKFGVIAVIRLWLAVRDARDEARAVLSAVAPDELFAFETEDLRFEQSHPDYRIAVLVEATKALETTD